MYGYKIFFSLIYCFFSSIFITYAQDYGDVKQFDVRWNATPREIIILKGTPSKSNSAKNNEITQYLNMHYENIYYFEYEASLILWFGNNKLNGVQYHINKLNQDDAENELYYQTVYNKLRSFFSEKSGFSGYEMENVDGVSSEWQIDNENIILSLYNPYKSKNFYININFTPLEFGSNY